MTWNYRVVKVIPEDTSWTPHYFMICEAFYDEGKQHPHSITERSISPYGESLEELKDDLKRMLKALEAPVLNHEEF